MQCAHKPIKLLRGPAPGVFSNFIEMGFLWETFCDANLKQKTPSISNGPHQRLPSEDKTIFRISQMLMPGAHFETSKHSLDHNKME